MTRLSHGDSPSTLIEEQWERAYRFAAMVTRNDQDSLDVAHEAMLRVLERLHQFDPAKGEFQSWLWRIVVNVAHDHHRTSGRRARLFDRLVNERRGSVADDPETAVIKHLDDRELLRAVRKLKKRPRTLIALRFGAGLSYAEIGDQMGISEAAALMAVRRALTALRKQLEEGV